MLTAKVSVKQHQNKPQAFTFNFMLKNHYYPYLPYIPPKTVKEKKKKQLCQERVACRRLQNI